MSKQNNDYWGPKMISGISFKYRNIFPVDKIKVITIPYLNMNYEYDFSLENSILAKIEEEKVETIPDPPKVNVHRFPISNTILEPKKFSQMPHTSQINKDVKDFVRDFDKLDDPFDLMELKTIDDKKELEDLLSNDLSSSLENTRLSKASSMSASLSQQSNSTSGVNIRNFSPLPSLTHSNRT